MRIFMDDTGFNICRSSHIEKISFLKEIRFNFASVFNFLQVTIHFNFRRYTFWSGEVE
jgi:hypothetical protein